MAALIDTRSTLERFRRELEAGAERDRQDLLLAVLSRWRHDPQLTDDSRRIAGQLWTRFATPHGADTV